MPIDDRSSRNRPRVSFFATAVMIAIFVILLVIVGLFIHANWMSLVTLGMAK
jgi:cell division protein FtsN